MKIAVLKPDYGVAGGFEYLLSRLVDHLGSSGHEIHHVGLPGRQAPRAIWGQDDAAVHWHKHPDFFGYVGLTHDVRQLDLSEFDLVLATQPPTYLAPHDRVLSLFYHQARMFYELADLYAKTGTVNAELHHEASRQIRTIDQQHLGGVTHWLAGSNECADRIREFWTTSAATSILDAPALTEVPESPAAWNASGPVLCVSRHEWPKRTELAVAAGHLLAEDRHSVLIGGGGRLDSVRSFDRSLVNANQDEINTRGVTAGLAAPSAAVSSIAQRLRGRGRGRAGLSTVQIHGQVTDQDRNRAYEEASVVLAPAYREDYGLTALEAMVWGRPVVVCNDGGGLVDLVQATGAGLVVEPTPQALADAVRTITDSPELAAELRGNAAEVGPTYTWNRAFAQLDDAVAQACAT